MHPGSAVAGWCMVHGGRGCCSVCMPHKLVPALPVTSLLTWLASWLACVQMEDLKGKIRVYCRVRPMLKFELEKGQAGE